jgi:hypothetical protein
MLRTLTDTAHSFEGLDTRLHNIASCRDEDAAAVQAARAAMSAADIEWVSGCSVASAQPAPGQQGIITGSSLYQDILTDPYDSSTAGPLDHPASSCSAAGTACKGSRLQVQHLHNTTDSASYAALPTSPADKQPGQAGRQRHVPDLNCNHSLPSWTCTGELAHQCSLCDLPAGVSHFQQLLLQGEQLHHSQGNGTCTPPVLSPMGTRLCSTPGSTPHGSGRMSLASAAAQMQAGAAPGTKSDYMATIIALMRSQLQPQQLVQPSAGQPAAAGLPGAGVAAAGVLAVKEQTRMQGIQVPAAVTQAGACQHEQGLQPLRQVHLTQRHKPVKHPSRLSVCASPAWGPQCSSCEFGSPRIALVTTTEGHCHTEGLPASSAASGMLMDPQNQADVHTSAGDWYQDKGCPSTQSAAQQPLALPLVVTASTNVHVSSTQSDMDSLRVEQVEYSSVAGNHHTQHAAGKPAGVRVCMPGCCVIC